MKKVGPELRISRSKDRHVWYFLVLFGPFQESVLTKLVFPRSFSGPQKDRFLTISLGPVPVSNKIGARPKRLLLKVFWGGFLISGKTGFDRNLPFSPLHWLLSLRTKRIQWSAM